MAARRILLAATLVASSLRAQTADSDPSGHRFDGAYRAACLDRVAFPIGGMGAGMFCLEGSGAVSHLSVRNRPELYNEPAMFAAIAVREFPEHARVLEGPVPDWKKFGPPGSALGGLGTSWGLPRFGRAEFLARFPFAEVELTEGGLPLAVHLTGWSPFIPTDPDNSGLPAGALEYRFRNQSSKPLHCVFSYNRMVSALPDAKNWRVRALPQGYVLRDESPTNQPYTTSEFAVSTDDPATVVNHCWYRGGWWDPLTLAWNGINRGEMDHTPAVAGPSPGASLFVPFELQPGAEKTIRVLLTWYTPTSNFHYPASPASAAPTAPPSAAASSAASEANYRPWYAQRFPSIEAVTAYTRANYHDLRAKSALFRDAFFRSSLPPEVMEAVEAGLTVLKSPTVLRQFDGRFWAWEGCNDEIVGNSAGTCTHVWNYAQALPHLFPSMERTLRETEFTASQNAEGHQEFRAALPIGPQPHVHDAAADGQLGGIMKVYREWRISGDSAWMRALYPKVKASLDYCIRTWDPDRTGILAEPHHNTYDIEFWGPDGMTTSYYLGALEAMIRLGSAVGDDTSGYRALSTAARAYMEHELWNGEYFIQKIQWRGLHAPDPVKALIHDYADREPRYAPLLEREGPPYQYGEGCLSDGVVGAWLAEVCGLPEPLDRAKVRSQLLASYRYNLKADLSNHSNPQRATYALGKEGGLLLCSWPRGQKPSLPFVYSDEVWTGIEYEVASHLMSLGQVPEGLAIVRTARHRYTGKVRNPFDEYEWGNWYARSMSSYALIAGLTGVRYDAVDRTLYVDSQIGNFTSFLSTATGFGNVYYRDGKARVEVVYGHIDVQRTVIGRGDSEAPRHEPG